MANTQHVIANRLTGEAKQSRRMVLMIGAPIAAILCILFPVISPWVLIAFLIIFLNAGTITRAGARGEDSTLEVLATLPDSYVIWETLGHFRMALT